MGAGDRPTVLVVEDEEALVEIYSRWLGDEYEVRTATNGEAALDHLDADVDVVLLDRLMPGMSGDEVLERVRDQNPDCKVAMVTAVEPDFDILRMGFDDYLTKPVDRDELLETVRSLLARDSYAALEQELYALVSKRAALQATKSQAELAESEEYSDLASRIRELQSQLDTTLPELGNEEFVSMVRDLEAENRNEGGDS